MGEYVSFLPMYPGYAAALIFSELSRGNDPGSDGGTYPFDVERPNVGEYVAYFALRVIENASAAVIGLLGGSGKGG